MQRYEKSRNRKRFLCKKYKKCLCILKKEKPEVTEDCFCRSRLWFSQVIVGLFQPEQGLQAIVYA